MGALSGKGAEVWLNLGARWQVGYSYLYGNENLVNKLTTTQLSTVQLTEFTASPTLAHLYTRYFIGNSFNIEFGFGQRDLDVDFAVTSNDGLGELRGNALAQSQVAVVCIGNQWVWENGETFGISWVGMTSVQSSSYKSTTTTTGVISTFHESLAADVEDLAEDLSKTDSSMAFILNLGFQI